MATENTAFIELNLNAGRLLTGLRSAQNAFKRTMGRFVGFANSSFRRIRRLFFNFRTWATLAAGAFTANKFMQEADKYRAAMIGLASIATFKAIPAIEAQQAASDLAADGLLTVQDAAKSLKNLLMRGYGLPRSIELMKRFKDAAAFGRQGMLSMGEAIVGATQGLKNEFSVLVDNAGVTKNVSVMWKEYGEQIGVTVGKLTQAQKVEAEYQGVIKETNAMVGNAAIMAKIWSGQVAALGNQIKLAMADVGRAMQKTLGDLGVLDLFKEKLTGITKWFNDNKGTIVEWWFKIGLTVGSIPELFSVAWNAVSEITKTSLDTQERAIDLFWQNIKLDPISILQDIYILTIGIGNTFARAIFNITKTLTQTVLNLGLMVGTLIVGAFDHLGSAIGQAVFNGLQGAKGHLNTFISFINTKFGLDIKPLEVLQLVPLTFSNEMEKSMAAVGLALESQWDDTVNNFKANFGDTVDGIINDLEFMGEALKDPLQAKNWEQGSNEIKNILTETKDNMLSIFNTIKAEAKTAGEIATKSLNIIPGSGQIPSVQTEEGPIFGPAFDKSIAKKNESAQKAYQNTIAGLYKDHITKILNSDSFNLEQKKILLAEEKTAYLSLWGDKIEGEKLFSQVTMEVQRQRFQELIDLNQTSEATMHEARMGFLETYKEAFKTANASMEELTLRFFTNFIGWYQGAFSSAMEQIVVDGKKASDVVHDLGMSFKRMLVRWAADYIAQQTIALAFSKKATATATAIAKAKELSQLGTAVPLATAVSLYSWGANAPPAIAGMTSASVAAAGLFAPKMHSGGEVDDSGPGAGNERLRVLQRGEFVIANDRRNIQVSVPQGSGGNTYQVNLTVNADKLDRNTVNETAEELADAIMEKINDRVERGETMKASEVKAA